MIFLIPITKPGRKRAICFKHYHLFRSPLFCPVCNLCVYLIHRILLIQRPLLRKDFLFVFDGTFAFYTPVTADIFAKTLKVISEKIGFFDIRAHNFKHGILTTLFESVEKELEFVSDRFYLAVADHKPNYSQEYIIPDLSFVNEKILRIRTHALNVFTSENTSEMFRVKSLIKRLYPVKLWSTHTIGFPSPIQSGPQTLQMLQVFFLSTGVTAQKKKIKFCYLMSNLV